MVLEELSNAADAPFAESAPPSDGDQYEPASLRPANSFDFSLGKGPPTYVDLDKIPRPFSANVPWMLKFVAESSQKTLGRPATQDEAEALAYHAAGAQRLGDMVRLPTLMGCFGYWALTMKSSPFPLWKQSATWDQNKFGPLKGPFAVLYWQVLRLSAWMLSGAVVSTAVMTGIGVYAIGPAYLGDPRLREFHAAARRQRQMGAATTPMPVDQSPGPRSGETIEMARQRSMIQERARRQKVEQLQQRQQQQEQQQRVGTTGRSAVDDASPTSGSFGDEFLDMGAESSQERSSGSWRSNAASSQRQDKSDRGQTSSVATSQSSGGSAWDRVRQQALSGQGESAPPSGVRSSTRPTRDLFEEEQRAAAQREFDARVQREREGREFEDNGNSRRSW